MSEFLYRPENHTYWYGDKQILSPTKVFDILGLNAEIKRWATEEHREKGSRIHLGYYRLVMGEMAWEWGEQNLPEETGHVRAMEKAIALTGMEPDKDKCEVPAFDKIRLYGTIPDIPGTIKGVLAIIEGKSGQMPETTAIQTAAQAMALYPKEYLKVKRIGVKTQANGIPIIKHFSDPNDFNVWINMLGAAYWAFGNGYAKEISA